MKQKGLLFEVGDLTRDKQGTRIAFEIKEKLNIDFGEDIKLISPFSAKVIFMKIDDGIHVNMKNVYTEFEFVCTRCGKKYKKGILPDESERIYFFENQHDIADIFDVYYIDIKNMTIDISEFVRQEIILHFPTILVCSNSCKGLCLSCGVDLNDTSCTCETSKPKQEKPLAILKTLYNAKASGSEKKDR